MQKAGLLLGLIAALGAAVYAYPGGDKRGGPIVKLSTEAGERDGPAPTALDKLKAATRGETVAAKPAASTEAPTPALTPAQAALPAPRVMDAVRQELSARPPVPAAPAASPVVVGHRASGSNGPSPVDEKSVEKLASRLAAEATGPAADKPATTLQPASISLTSAPTAAPAAETAKQAAAAAADATAAKQEPARKKAAAARVERRKSATSADGQPAKVDRRSPMSGIARSGYAPNTVTRFDGL